MCVYIYTDLYTSSAPSPSPARRRLLVNIYTSIFVKIFIVYLYLSICVCVYIHISICVFSALAGAPEAAGEYIHLYLCRDIHCISVSIDMCVYMCTHIYTSSALNPTPPLIKHSNPLSIYSYHLLSNPPPPSLNV